MDKKLDQNKSVGGRPSIKGPNNLAALDLATDQDAPLIPLSRTKRDEDGNFVPCRFISRFKHLSGAQIAIGFVLVCLGLYTHFPVFSGGYTLLAGEDLLWYATWIGGVNILTGVFGRLATKRSITESMHIWVRRTYFIFNAALCLYSNGIGISAYGISLSHYDLITPGADEKFTTIMAFLCIIVLIVALAFNLMAVVYQVLATKQCKCYICDPKSRHLFGLARKLAA